MKLVSENYETVGLVFWNSRTTIMVGGSFTGIIKSVDTGYLYLFNGNV